MKKIILLLIGLNLTLIAGFEKVGDVITDDISQLQWQDNSDAKAIKKNWFDALTYCEALSLGEEDDWRLPNIKELFVAGILVLVPMLLIVKQPDLGTALLVGSAGFFVIYFAGLPWKWLAATAVTAMIAAPLVFYFGMHDYQRQRVLTLFNPDADRLGSGYHIIQSTIAIGSGGFYGKGWLKGDQSRLDFLPERHTDFIFAVFGEEFGLLGNMILFSLYIFIIWRGLYLATKGQDTYARLLGGSLSLTFFIYLLVNTGMVIGILPVVGVPLPLVSYGGTSLVTLMVAFGLLMGLRRRKKGYDE